MAKSNVDTRQVEDKLTDLLKDEVVPVLRTLQKKLSDDNSADKLPDLPKPFSLKDLKEQPSDQTKVQGTTPNQPVILLPKLIQYSEAGVPITEQEVLIVEGTQERIKTVPWQDCFLPWSWQKC